MASIIKVDQIQSDGGTITTQSNVRIGNTSTRYYSGSTYYDPAFTVDSGAQVNHSYFNFNNTGAFLALNNNYTGGNRNYVTFDTANTRVADFYSTNGVDLTMSNIGQIKFPAAQHSSSDANTLDDYEEGTYTPTDVSGAGLTLTVNRAHYVKIGTHVLVTCSITWPSTASGSTAYVSLPFEQGIPGYYAGNGSVGYNTYGAYASIVVENRGVQAALFYNAAGTTLSNANLSTKRMDFTISYISNN